MLAFKGQLAELEYVGVTHNGMAFRLTEFNHRRFLEDKKIFTCSHLPFAIWDI